MMGFGSPSQALLDQFARDAAGEANAAIAVRRSRKRIHIAAAQTISAANTETKINCSVIHSATGLFAGGVEADKVVIPAGVSKVRLYLGAYIGTSTTGVREFYANLRSGAGVLLMERIGILRTSSPGNSSHYSWMSVSGVVEVSEGDYLELFGSASVTPTTFSFSASAPENYTYLEVEAVE